MKLVTFLVDQGSPIDATDDTDTTPLIVAASCGRAEVVAYLLKKGANVNQKTTQGHSALQYAASKGWSEVMNDRGIWERWGIQELIKWGIKLRFMCTIS